LDVGNQKRGGTMNPTVREIVQQWLIEHEYDGLLRPDGDVCGCCNDDLMPCDGDVVVCVAAYMNHYIEDGDPVWALSETRLTCGERHWHDGENCTNKIMALSEHDPIRKDSPMCYYWEQL
jgi:hypothetical protein